MSSNISLQSILDAYKLIGPNFLNWNWNVRIVLKQEKRLHVLENPIPNTHVEDAEEEVRNEHQRHVDDDDE